MADPPMTAPKMDWVRECASSTPDAAAVVFDERTTTYAMLDAAADRLAEELRAKGTGRGSLMAFSAIPRPETLELLVGGPRAGATLAPFGPMPPGPHPDAPVGAYAVVTTSGSSGDAKGVILTEQNVTAALAASQRRLGNDATDRWLLCLPLYHIAGLSVVWRSLAAGGSVLIHDRFEAALVAGALKAGAVSMASLVPTMLHRVLEVDPGPYEGVKAVLLGGGPASRDLVTRSLDAGLPVLATYGTTETCSQVATVSPGTEKDAIGSVGRPLDGMSVTIEQGEILVDGPAVSPGYIGEPPRAGPHRTRDLGHFDDSGRLVVTGRKDEVILTGGEKVAPHLVEAVLESFPTISRAVVVGMPDDDWGQAVVAVFEGDEPDETALGARARAALAVHQVPKRWVRVDALPELSSGKVDRPAVAAMVDAARTQGS